MYNSKHYLSSSIRIEKIESQINFAKRHGIYGFGFYYFWPSNRSTFNKPIDIFVENKNLNIKFLLIIKNEEKKISYNYSIIYLFNEIKKYVMDSRYIKFEKKIVIGLNDIVIKENEIKILRQLFYANKLGKIFVLSNANDENIQNIISKNIFDGIYFSAQYNSLEKIFYSFDKSFRYFYTHLLYHNIFVKFPNAKKIYRTSEALRKYSMCLNNSENFIYGDYSPEKFYFLNKIIMNWTKKNHNIENRFIFIDNYYNLEQDDLYGFSNINYFSKALYEYPITESNFNLKSLKYRVLISVQIHIYYIDLLADIINKTNNIPASHDLYITTNNNEKKIYIEKYLKLNSKANKYEILIFSNKGRDVIPFLFQFKEIFRNYKYVCHLHSKKHNKIPKLGNNWRVYLYENLLGNKNIISQILFDFESNNRLGLIFPEPFYLIIKFVYNMNPTNIKQLNRLAKILFPTLKIKLGYEFIFPAGNMFWAKTEAIYQMFNEKVIQLSPKEKGQSDGTILHAIERFWPILTKLNGFYYKTILYFI